MPERPRFMVTLPAPHDATLHMARVMHEEGMLGDFVVPLDATGWPRPPAWLGSRVNIDQWRYPLPARSAAPFAELVVAATFRLFAGRRFAVGTRAMASWRASRLDRFAARRLMNGPYDAVTTMHGRTPRVAVAATRSGAGLVHFLNHDPWGLCDRLSPLADSADDPAVRRELLSEILPRAIPRASAVLRRSAAVVVESCRMAHQAQLSGTHAPAIVVGQGVAAEFFVPAARDGGIRPLRAVQVSRVVHGKGVNTTGEAVRLAASAVESCTVAGWDADAAPSIVRHNSHLQFTGGLSRAGVRDLLQRSDVFVLPTLADPMPRAALEAMACGLPVITTTDSGYADLIEHGVNGFFVPLNNAEAVAALLDRLSRDPDLRERVGKAARATAEANTWEHFGENFRRRLYGELLPALELQAASRVSASGQAP